MNRRVYLTIFSVLAVILSLASILIFPEWIKLHIIPYILTAAGQISRTWKSMDPDSVWIIFLVVSAGVLLLGLPEKESSSSSQMAQAERPTTGRVFFWLREIRHLTRQPEYTRFSVLELRRLVLDVVAFRQRLSLRQAEIWLHEHPADVPPEVVGLFDPHMPAGSVITDDVSGPWWRALFVRSKSARPDQQLQNNRRLDVVLKFIEKELRTGYDN